jgi:light-regulated signal transduction histidine kinase (bacteriophytochrome)
LNSTTTNPAFGQADLSNCERELIHLAGSIQPHGALLVLRQSDLAVLQASANTAPMLGVAVDDLLGRPAAALGGDLRVKVDQAQSVLAPEERHPLRCHVEAGGQRRELEGLLHRLPGGHLALELEPLADGGPEQLQAAHRELELRVADAVQRLSGAGSIDALMEAVVACFRGMTGYDRVMAYRFDPDGHGQVIAEARAEGLEPLLGHHYPASDIPQRARELYIRNRARVLVDANYVPVPVVPRRIPGTDDELDMSLCWLRSMSPLHIQYLKNMGVTATLVVSLVREGQLWGLVACHHYSPKPLHYAVRAAAELLGEVIATRIAVLENRVLGQVGVLLRRLERRLVEAASTDGDWRAALFQEPRALLQPLGAAGVALMHAGEMMTTGEVPSTAGLRSLVRWLSARPVDSLFSCESIERADPALASLSPTASGVLAVRLSPARPDFLIWLRPEQVAEVTWAGDPAKPMIDDDPLNLSPRRSFAAWSQIVRGSAVRWTRAEMTLARAIGASLADFMMQVQVVQLLIAQHQLAQVRREVSSAMEPVAIADAAGAILFMNESLADLLPADRRRPSRLEDLAPYFAEPIAARAVLDALLTEHRSWQGELTLAATRRGPLPVSLRADLVPGPLGLPLGFIVILTDLTVRRRTSAARDRFEAALAETRRAEELAGSTDPKGFDAVIGAILADAGRAARDLGEVAAGAETAPLLEELEASTKHASALYRQLRDYTRGA